jgi:hypothetical protein
MKRIMLIAVAVFGLPVLGGCAAFSEEHPVSESRYATPEMQAYWLDRRWRQDIADRWSAEIERQAAARMSYYMGH